MTRSTVVRSVTVFLLVMVSGALPAQTGEWRVGPSGDADCDFNDIQDAIDTTVANDGGLSTINVRVAGSAADHLGNTYIIDAAGFDSVDTFRIIGGHDSCAASSPSAGAQTVLDAAGNGRVFHLIYNAGDADPVRNIELSNLEITGGDASSAGGGIRIQGHSGRHRIQLNNLLVSGNTTRNVGSGGGISIETDQASDSPTSWVTISQESIIHNNRADGSGGGLACFNTSGGANPPVLLFNTAIISNQAVFNGGGLLLSGCKNFSVRSAGFDNGIRLNVAGSEGESGDGGGVHVASGGALILEASGNEKSAVVFGNGADNGGGLSVVDDGSTVELINARITTNSANADGGGILVRDADLTMGRHGGVSGLAGDCLPMFDSSSRCSTLFGNTAGGDGGAIAVHGPESGRVNRATLEQTLIDGNFSDGGRGSAAFVRLADLIIEGAAVYENSGSPELFHLDDNATMVLSWSTVAGNFEKADNDRIFRIDGQFTSLFADGSIFWEPGQELVSAAHSTDARADCVIGHLPEVDAGLSSTSFYSQIDPQLRDPGSGDLRLSLSSPAVDYCNDEAAFPPEFKDMFNNARGTAVDGPINQPPNAPGGPFDLGAHELQSLARQIFADRFEDG